MMTYGDYLKAWGRIHEAADQVYLEFMDRDDDPQSATRWKERTPQTEDQKKRIELFRGDRYRLNASLAASPEYFERLQLWRVSIYGPCCRDEWTPCPPVRGLSVQGDMAADLEEDHTQNVHADWEPPREDLRQQAHDYCRELGFDNSGSGGGMGGWDISLVDMTDHSSRRTLHLLVGRFRAEILKGQIELRRFSNLTDYHKLSLEEPCAT